MRPETERGCGSHDYTLWWDGEWVNGDELLITIRTGGGCGTHDYTRWWDGALDASLDSPQLNIVLSYVEVTSHGAQIRECTERGRRHRNRSSPTRSR